VEPVAIPALDLEHLVQRQAISRGLLLGMTDPVLGPTVMRSLHAHIRNCPSPLEIADGGHFLQEWGDTIAHKAVDTL